MIFLKQIFFYLFCEKSAVSFERSRRRFISDTSRGHKVIEKEYSRVRFRSVSWSIYRFFIKRGVFRSKIICTLRLF